MRFLVAPNTLKGSLTAFDAARAISEGLRLGSPGAECEELPIADGGDLTLQVLVKALDGDVVEVDATDALGRPFRARYGWVQQGSTAIIEVAEASGLAKLAPEERDPRRASSYGTGQLMLHALEAGAKRFVIGVGGSATVDGGVGLAHALGAVARDARGAVLSLGGAALGELATLDVTRAQERFGDAELTVLCDVDNPLLGESGSAPIFAPQKGASPVVVRELERGLGRLADALEAVTGRRVHELPRGGAAGGIPALLHAVFGAKLERGIDWILSAVDFETRVRQADVVVTAEGLLDRQTLGNKAPHGVALAARRLGRPVIVLAGGVSDDLGDAGRDVFDAIIPICQRPAELELAMRNAHVWMREAARQTARVLHLAGSLHG
jgi:glycerate 2-kinase